MFVAQTDNDRAVTIPWIKARATYALAGLLARGSQLDARPSQVMPDLAFGPVAGGLGFHNRPRMCIALAAYSCRDSCGFE
jgi:hypothetical protein